MEHKWGIDVIVSISGIDCSGKSTVCRRLEAMASAAGFRAARDKIALVDNEPFRAYQDTLRRMPHAIAASARGYLALLESVKRLGEVEARAASFDFMFMDRYAIDSIIFLAVRHWEMREAFTMLSRWRGDHEVVLDVPISTARRRSELIGESWTDDFVSKLETTRCRLLDWGKGGGVQIVDGSQPIDAIAEQIWISALDRPDAARGRSA